MCTSNPLSKLSAQIDADLKEEAKKRKPISLLLLGAGESGKSTIFKQMRLLNIATFGPEERAEFRVVLRGNIISSLKTLIQANEGKLGKGKTLEASQRILQMVSGNEDWTPEQLEDVKKLIADKAITKAAETRHAELQLLESTKYIFEHVDRIAAAGFTPTDDDILKARKMTTGITEVTWEHKNTQFRLTDVGGQRNQRAKWIHCFQGVTAVLFVAAINEFDMQLREDISTNRLHEALSMFGSLVNSEWFRTTDFIIFFNKHDLFEEKAKHVDLKVCFPEYTGGLDPVAARDYIKEKFMEMVMKSNRAIYTHFTCATDTTNIKVIWERTREGFFKDVLAQGVGVGI